MKTPEEKIAPPTADLHKKGRGRPVTGEAMTDAERAAAYRARKKAQGLVKRYVPKTE